MREIDANTGLAVGDRIRLSEAGRKASPRMRVQTGELISFAKKGTGGRSVEVLFDGNKAPTRLHRSYIERDSLDQM